MGFFQTLATGYKLMANELIFKVKNNSDKIITGSGAGIMAIGAALFARTGAKEEARKAIDEANQVIAECKAEVEAVKVDGTKETLKEARKKYYKARVKKLGTIVKVYRKPLATEVAGGVMVVTGMIDSKHKLEKSSAATAVMAAEFMNYRRNVIAEEGEEADRKYLTSKYQPPVKQEMVDEDTGEGTEVITPGGLVIDKDPKVFRFWFSEETCPSTWDPNFELRKAKLRHLQDEYDIKLRTCGHLTLNDQRRAFGGLAPEKMDVGVGGIFGRLWEPGNPEHPERGKALNWHFEEDQDFMDGRSTGCWIIFDVEEAPIINKIGKKFTQTER